MIKSRQHFCLHHFIQRRHIQHHAGLRIDRSAHQHLNHVVVPMAMRIIALSIRGLVLLSCNASVCSR